MILEDSEVISRVESPLNLLNRLKSNLSKKPSNGLNIIPSLPPTVDSIVDDIEDKIKVGTIKSKAASIMSDCLDSLRIRLPEVVKPEKLASIAAEMNKVIGDKGADKPLNAQVIIYAPQHKSENHFEVITVNE